MWPRTGHFYCKSFSTLYSQTVSYISHLNKLLAIIIMNIQETCSISPTKIIFVPNQSKERAPNGIISFSSIFSCSSFIPVKSHQDQGKHVIWLIEQSLPISFHASVEKGTYMKGCLSYISSTICYASKWNQRKRLVFGAVPKGRSHPISFSV